jgi:putative oxidoreductase
MDFEHPDAARPGTEIDPLDRPPAGAMRSVRRPAPDVRQAIERSAPVVLRWSLAVVYLWFGALKLTGSSPVTTLVTAAIPFGDPEVVVRVLGVLELVIGLGLLSRRAHRVFLAVVVLHLAGTFSTVAMAPELLWRHGNPALLTTEGEFVLKNLVLATAALLLVVLTRPTADGQRDRPTD